jgi:hypothetical protein
MAKILSLRLNYKGKFLDYAKEGKEIKKSFTIGSNKYLQWQILEPSFPDKHTFIQQKGGEYVMQLLPGAQLSCEKGGNPVDSNFLKQNNLLSGNELVLKKDIKGTLTISPDWSVDFEYKEPWVAILTAEEKQIVAQYARREKPDAVSRFNRMILWLVLLLSIVFILIFDLFLKKEYNQEETVAQRLQSIQAQAQRVTPDITPTTGSFVEQTPAETESPEQVAQEGSPGGTATRASSALDAAFAGGFDAGNIGIAPTVVDMITIQEGFPANRRGGGTSGSGTGINGSGGTTRGAGSLFDASNTPSFGNVGAVVQQGPSSMGYDQVPEGAVGEHIKGDASKLAISGIAWGDVVKQKQIEAEYARKGIQTVREGSVAGLDEASLARVTTLREQIESRRVQIEQAYREFQLRQRTSFDITLFINSNGTVRESQVVPNGAYPEAFVSKVKSIVDDWVFNIREATAYQFKVSAGS